MDVISQAVLGASLAQSFAKDKSKQLAALLIGALSGMAPDLDVLITSGSDPLLFLEYHRQFTHSLFFIPFGALACALVFYGIFRSRMSFSQVYLFSILGYSTHGLLDACTSYGTQLLWPFTNERFAWDIVSIVDPFFTLPVLVGIVFAVVKRKQNIARVTFIYALVFLSFGFLQKYRATEALYALADERGHSIERVITKPSFANRHVWKMIYEADGRYYVDAVKLLWDIDYFAGASVLKLDIKRDYPWMPVASQQAKDIERFRWFSGDYLAVNPVDDTIIIDVRYSIVPNQIKLMWGIQLDHEKIKDGDLTSHVKFIVNSELNAKSRQEFADIIF
ncbi:MAG: metal-dependent hydrolase [Gammaproteobacteria bacterium]|nr:metal-dependent hydrolase [Gammaproteobacteria bacterium]